MTGVWTVSETPGTSSKDVAIFADGYGKAGKFTYVLDGNQVAEPGGYQMGGISDFFSGRLPHRNSRYQNGRTKCIL